MVVTYQLLGVGDAFWHEFVLFLRLFESVRVVSIEDVLGVTIFQVVEIFHG